MLALFAVLLAPFVALFAPGVNAYYPQGTIPAPANGTKIAPGAAFNFTYNIRADYCVSSFNYTVYLLTQLPSSKPPFFIGTDNQIAAGHYFGRWQGANYPALTNPNLAPAQLVMPDFSKSPGGFASGMTAHNVPVYLAVFEEWAECQGMLGTYISLAVNHLVYNATS